MTPERKLIERIADTAVETIAADLPPGWRVILILEKLAEGNDGTAYGLNYKTRSSQSRTEGI